MTNFDFLRQVCADLHAVAEDKKNPRNDDTNIIITAERPFNTSGHDVIVYLQCEDQAHAMALVCSIIEGIADQSETTVDDILEHICPALDPTWAADHEVYPDGEN